METLMMSETDASRWGYAQTDSTRWGYAQTELNDKGKDGRMAQIETESQTDRYGYAQSKATSFAFAEQDAEVYYHKCTTAMDRNKNTKDDYYVWYNDGVDVGDPYTDPNFPLDDALWWLDAGE
jgi:hypothetical protein